MDSNKSSKSFIKRHIAGIIIILLVIFVAVGGAYLWLRNQKPEPQNLGPQLEYVGTHNSACEWWQTPLYAGWCKGPSYEYYFATDLNEETLKTYFKNVSKATSASPGGSNADYSFKYLNYAVNGSDFYLTLYDNTTNVLKAFGLKQTGKPYVISLTDKNYELARKALQ